MTMNDYHGMWNNVCRRNVILLCSFCFGEAEEPAEKEKTKRKMVVLFFCFFLAFFSFMKYNTYIKPVHY